MYIIKCLTTPLNNFNGSNGKRLSIKCCLQFAIHNEWLYSGFVLDSVQIYCMQKSALLLLGGGGKHRCPLSEIRSGYSLYGLDTHIGYNLGLLKPDLSFLKTL